MAWWNCCCDPIDPDDCCTDEDMVEPIVSISGYSIDVIFGSRCCHTFSFVPDDTSSVASCCSLLSENSIEYTCDSEDWGAGWNNTIAAWEAGCPVSSERCCPEPVLLATWVEKTKLTQRNYFAADFYVVSARVVIGKEEIRCDPDAEPVCRWFARLIVTLRYSASVNTQILGEGSLQNTFLKDCWIVSVGYHDQTATSTSCDDSEKCLSDPEFGSPCISNRGASAANDCFEASGEVCVQRIKFFSTRPEGTIAFTEYDILASTGCDDTVCGSRCSGWEQSICVSSPASILPPHWCTDPPTVVRTETTCEPQFGPCDLRYDVNEFLCAIGTSSCDPPTTCPPMTFTRTCDVISVPDWEIDPLECRFNSALPSFYFMGCLCTGESVGLEECLQFSPALNRIGQKTCEAVSGSGLCDDATCCENVICDAGGDPFNLWCDYKQRFYGFWAENSLSIDLNCGSYTQASCCYTLPTISVTITWP